VITDRIFGDDRLVVHKSSKLCTVISRVSTSSSQLCAAEQNYAIGASAATQRPPAPTCAAKSSAWRLRGAFYCMESVTGNGAEPIARC
jgi:hypothetical protein